MATSELHVAGEPPAAAADHPPPRIAYLTAGAAGMFCGSCIHDNTLCRALATLGCDVSLIPTYTPIRTDEVDVSLERIYFGGINVYLQQHWSLFRHVPRWMDRWLDMPWLIRYLASGNIDIDAAHLGAMTVTMLRGEAGHLAKEHRRLVHYLADHLRPEVLDLTNMLIAGCVPLLKRKLDIPVIVTLQGDDIFLRDLPEPYREQSLQEIQRLSGVIDGYLTYTHYYADFMSDYLHLPRDRFQIVPLGMDLDDYRVLPPQAAESRPPTVGYFARICPAKGLHVLVDAFVHLRRMPGMEETRLHIAGWLGEGDRPYYDEQRAKLRDAGLADAVDELGVVDRQGKLHFFRDIDVLSVPTTYREPKGLYVLEALASGVPVVQPNHGAFPELLTRFGGGRLFQPDDPVALAETLHELLRHRDEARALGLEGRARVFAEADAPLMAQRTLEVYRRLVEASA